MSRRKRQLCSTDITSTVVSLHYIRIGPHYALSPPFFDFSNSKRREKESPTSVLIMGAINKNSTKNPRSPVSRIRPFPRFRRIFIYYLALLPLPLLILLFLTKENIHSPPPPPPPPSSSSHPLFSYLLTPELEIMRLHVLSLLGIGGALINVAYSAAIALAPRQTASPGPIIPEINEFVESLSLDPTAASEVATKLNESAVALNLTSTPPPEAKLRKRTLDLATDLACWIIQLKFAADSCEDGSTTYTTLSTLNWFVSSPPIQPANAFVG